MTTGLKPLDEIYEPDVRQRHMARINIATGEAVPLQLADLHGDISKIVLSGTPPPDVVTLFDRARNLYVYSWFVYDFTTPARSQAYATVELALRERLSAAGTPPNKRRGLRRLLKDAMKRGWLKDGGFPHIQHPVAPEPHEAFQRRSFDPEGTEYCKMLLKAMSDLRNDLAHGSPFLVGSGGSLGVFEVCAAIINQLFPPETGAA